MYYQLNKSTVFKRYNAAVVIAFLVIIILALFMASVRYFYQLSNHKQQSSAVLKQKVYQLNNILEQSVQAVDGIHGLAQYYLKRPAEISGYLPKLSQESKMFYLDIKEHDIVKEGRRLNSNITGTGNVSDFTADKSLEITMANALTPAFVSAQKIIKQATWFYYISLDQFVSLYPWVDRDVWHFNSTTLKNPLYQTMKKFTETNNQAIWSAPYLDSAGTGRKTSLGKAVFYQQKQIGAVVIDISLTRLHAKLPELDETGNAGLVLYNKDNHILLFKSSGNDPLNAGSTWKELLPKSLSHLNANTLAKMKSTTKLGDWFIEKESLNINGWTLLKYQSYDAFTSNLRSNFAFVFIILFVALLAFLMLVNHMTKRTFIRPTIEFIRHIEFCSEGDPGKVKPNADWLHWFQVVEDIFTQNRSLLLQLTEHNDVLDTRVIEKTQALQETSAKHQRDYVLLRSVMNAIPELIIFNDPDGLLMGCNQSFEQLTNYSERDMLGVKAMNFMPEALAKEINYLNTVCGEVYPQQALIEAGNFTYQGFCNQFKNAQGDVLGTISIFRDVTLQQAIKSALEKAKDQAEYANQVKIQFLANMSHEVRTPINAMQGMMDLLNNTSLNSRQQHYLVNAQRASTTLLHLIDELLDLSKIESDKMVINYERVNLPEVIDKALKLNITNVNSDKVIIAIDLDAKVPSYVMSDEMRLVQVFANLFSNAIKFTEDGQVSLKVVALEVKGSDVLVSFSMTDTGIGIAKEKQGHLFEAFSQADDSMTRKYGGSGLGLSICQHIIQRLGGNITLESELGKGSKFSFNLTLKHVGANENLSLTIANSNHRRANENNFTPVAVCSIRQRIPKSFKVSVGNMGGHFYQFDSITELCAAGITLPIVLLVDESIFNQQMLERSDHELFINSKQDLQLLCICQPVMTPLSHLTSTLLDKLNGHYLLLDLPLFRYSLKQITRTLDYKQQGEKEIFPADDANLFLDESQESPHSDEKISDINKNLSSIEILLVEDNLVNQLVAKELLITMKASVTIADNGQCALDLLSEKSFDVVLMDIQMPVMDGLTAAKKIREQSCYSQLPIIAMTAHAREEDKQHSLSAGMNKHIAKPITAKLLLDTIIDVLALAKN
jgi:signal transduction histidine kinase/ActR/RegA family two-component response regulator